MPILRAVLMTRQAISPRLAIRIFLNINGPPKNAKPPPENIPDGGNGD
jgi:hypothetical protein